MKYFLHIALSMLLAGISLQKGFAQQEPLYSQYMVNRLVLNPAYAGSKELVSATAVFRQQWTGIDRAPETQTLGFHFPSKNLRNGFGMLAVRDQVGFTQNTSLLAAYALRIPLGEQSRLSLGIQGGMNQYRVSLSEAETYETGDVAFEGTDFTRWHAIAGAGIWFQHPKVFAGFSVPNVFANILYDDFWEQLQSRRFPHYLLTGGTIFGLGPDLKFMPSFLMRAVWGAPVTVDVNGSFILKDRIRAGVSWRGTGDWVFLGELYLTQMVRIGYAYDLVRSDLSGYAGPSHEFFAGIELGFSRKRMQSPRFF